MRLLHTSDWHIGHALGRNKRYDEFARFLEWLAGTVADERIDALVVAGDVFDSGSPTNRAQELYYKFLCRVAAGPCRHVVVVAGNHDSPTFLNAPRELLKALDIHVVGAAGADPAEQAIALKKPTGEAELIVCAVPYLRDRDVRESVAGESPEDKDRNLIAGVRAHYAAVLAAARAKREALGGAAPLVATGHLFAAGGSVVADDGVRDLYVGSLVHVPADVFPEEFDYVALGHLHAPQIVAGDETRRYSGAPLPMGFGEAGREKSVAVVDFGPDGTRVRTLPVPVFRPLEKIVGDWPEISARLTELAAGAGGGWLDVEYTGEELMPDLHSRVAEIVADADLAVVKIGNRKLARLALARNSAEETLDDLDPAAVFERCLEAHGVADADREELRRTYAEIVHLLHDADARSE